MTKTENVIRDKKDKRRWILERKGVRFVQLFISPYMSNNSNPDKEGFSIVFFFSIINIVNATHLIDIFHFSLSNS